MRRASSRSPCAFWQVGQQVPPPAYPQLSGQPLKPPPTSSHEAMQMHSHGPHVRLTHVYLAHIPPLIRHTTDAPHCILPWATRSCHVPTSHASVHATVAQRRRELTAPWDAPPAPHGAPSALRFPRVRPCHATPTPLASSSTGWHHPPPRPIRAHCHVPVLPHASCHATPPPFVYGSTGRYVTRPSAPVT